MPESLRQEEFHLGSLAVQWISHMCQGELALAERLLAHDCGLVGFDIEKNSSIYVPARMLGQLPNLTIRRVHAEDFAIAIDVETCHATSAKPLYRIHFRFRFDRITKVHFCSLDD